MRPSDERLDAVDPEGTVFDLDTFAVHDGPGIRLAVYLKGCQLACKWCHSPESISPCPQLIFVRDRCALCRACVGACQQGVHEVSQAGHAIARARCAACGRCVGVCPTGALAIKGTRLRASEVVARATRLRPFFDHSGGGVTLTGGEVTCQPDFAETALAGCRAQGIHTAIETNGDCEWEVLERLARHCDLVLYDLKLIDEAAHLRWTGASNSRILANAARLREAHVQVRAPLIPGVTDTDANVSAVIAFLRKIGLRSIAFLPFNPSAAAKYEWLGRRFPFAAERQPRERLDRILALAAGAGLDASLA